MKAIFFKSILTFAVACLMAGCASCPNCRVNHAYIGNPNGQLASTSSEPRMCAISGKVYTMNSDGQTDYL